MKLNIFLDLNLNQFQNLFIKLLIFLIFKFLVFILNINLKYFIKKFYQTWNLLQLQVVQIISQNNIKRHQ